MPEIDMEAPGKTLLLMGNEAIARGALEAGVGFVSSYAGTPSSEILPTIAGIAKRCNIYAEWSVNEMVSMMNAAGASMAGVRAMATMKQNGTNVALDFIATQLTRGQRQGAGLVLVNCDDPGQRNSPNEQDTRPVAKWLDMPLLEPGDFQEAKDMTKWLFELSEELDLLCMLRCVSKISHTRGNVKLGEISDHENRAHFPLSIVGRWGMPPHAALHEKIEKARQIFETSPFNRYLGPDEPELLIITCGSGWLHSQEALRLLDVEDRVGILKLGTLSPLPEKLVGEYLGKSSRVLFVEETDPFVEQSVMELAAGLGPDAPRPVFYGKRSGHIPGYGEINPDITVKAVADIVGMDYQARDPSYSQQAEATSKSEVIMRSGALCPGCPHRASFWAIKNALRLDGRYGFMIADNGCNGASQGPGGYLIAKASGAMGTGAGVADGMGKLGQFGFAQPVIGSVGDSTFYHACIPPLLNGVWNKSNFVLVVYDNSATAMTGWQPHPGTGDTAMGDPAPAVSVEAICRSMGVRVEICDPFDPDSTTATMLDVMRDEGNGPRVVVMRRECELARARREG
ncbi:MAG: thiamine pyrophosphate-dependent enzyme, partial [Dehalococcoidia bacterium]